MNIFHNHFYTTKRFHHYLMNLRYTIEIVTANSSTLKTNIYVTLKASAVVVNYMIQTICLYIIDLYAREIRLGMLFFQDNDFSCDMKQQIIYLYNNLIYLKSTRNKKYVRKEDSKKTVFVLSLTRL